MLAIHRQERRARLELSKTSTVIAEMERLTQMLDGEGNPLRRLMILDAIEDCQTVMKPHMRLELIDRRLQGDRAP